MDLVRGELEKAVKHERLGQGEQREVEWIQSVESTAEAAHAGE